MPYRRRKAKTAQKPVNAYIHGNHICTGRYENNPDVVNPDKFPAIDINDLLIENIFSEHEQTAGFLGGNIDHFIAPDNKALFRFYHLEPAEIKYADFFSDPAFGCYDNGPVLGIVNCQVFDFPERCAIRGIKSLPFDQTEVKCDL
jgi:hypothetical protein